MGFTEIKWIGAPGINYDSIQARGLRHWCPSHGRGATTLRDIPGAGQAPFDGTFTGANMSRGAGRERGWVPDYANVSSTTTALVDFGSNFMISTTAPYTICFWMFNRGVAGSGSEAAAFCFIQHTAAVNAQSIFISNTATVRPINIGAAGDSPWVRGVDSRTGSNWEDLYPINQWHHIALTFDGVSATTLSSFGLVINGIKATLVAQTAVYGAAVSNSIGAQSGSSNPLHGMMDDFRVYDYALPDNLTKAIWAPATRWELYRAEQMPVGFISAALVDWHPGIQQPYPHRREVIPY